MIRSLAFLFLATTAQAAEKEHVYRDRFCQDMRREVHLPNGTRADCVSGRLAIEIEFSEKFHQALGQAMSYSASTGHWPAVILICRKKPKRCRAHLERLRDAATDPRFPVPLTVWMCRTTDERLSDCRRDDPPNSTIQGSKSRRKVTRRIP